MSSTRTLRPQELVTAVSLTDFRQLMYESATEALRHGGILEHVSGTKAHYDESRRTAESYGTGARIIILRDQVNAHRASAKKSRSLAVQATNPATQTGFMDDADDHEGRATHLEGEIAKLTAVAEAPREVGPFTTDASFIVEAIAGLVLFPFQVDADVAIALRRVIADVSVTEFSDSEVHVEWWLRIPTGTGVLRFGPLRFALAHHAPFAVRALSAISRFAIAAGHEQELGNRPWENYVRFLRHELIDLGVPRQQATILATCPAPEVIDIISARLLKKPMPKGLDPAFIDHIQRTYIDEPVSWGNKWATDNLRRQLSVDVVASLGGHATVNEVAARTSAFFYKVRNIQVTSLTRPRVNEDRSKRDEPPVLTTAHTGRVPAHATIRLVECRHCGHGVDWALRVPEVAEDMMLCRNCWKMPRIENSPTFPKTYGGFFRRALDEMTEQFTAPTRQLNGSVQELVLPAAEGRQGP